MTPLQPDARPGCTASRLEVVEYRADGNGPARSTSRRLAGSPAPRSTGAVRARRRAPAHRRGDPAADPVRRRAIRGRHLDHRLGPPHPVAPRGAAPVRLLHAGTPARARGRARGAQPRDQRRGSVPRVRRVGLRRASRRRGVRGGDRSRRAARRDCGWSASGGARSSPPRRRAPSTSSAHRRRSASCAGRGGSGPPGSATWSRPNGLRHARADTCAGRWTSGTC